MQMTSITLRTAILAAGLAMFVEGCIGEQTRPETWSTASETNTWESCAMPEYGLHFRYPSAAVVGQIPDALGGAWGIDGLKRTPIGIHLMPFHSSSLISGVGYSFEIRFIMLMEAAQLHRLTAKGYGWTARPAQPPYPYSYDHHLADLRVAIERLYLLWPLDSKEEVRRTLKVEPVIVDGYRGGKFSFWNPIFGQKRATQFVDIIAAPVSPKETIVIHAGYNEIKNEGDLRERRALFLKIVNTVRFDKPKTAEKESGSVP
jgi:hypothetical protein